MKHLITIILLSVTLFSFKGDKNVKYFDFYNHPIKQKRAFYAQKFTENEPGKWHAQKRIISNGLLKEDGYYSDAKITVKNGPFTIYDFDGHLESVVNYLNNKKTGDWKTYFSNGSIKSTGNYINGKKEGVWTYYFLSGDIERTGEYMDNKVIGPWVNYHDKAGTVAWGRNYNENGKEDGESEFYFENGQLDKKGNYSNGKKTGEWLYFFQSGEQSGLVNFEDGEVVSEQYWNMDGSDQTDIAKANAGFQFPGGESEMYSFLGKTMRYPALARDQNIQGRVYVSFYLDPQGNINNATIARGVHPVVDEEALKTVNAMPKWDAGLVRNRAMSIKYNLPILFKLQ